MPRQLRLTRPAQEDIDGIWSYTAKTYDVDQALRYAALLRQAFLDIEEDPERPSSLTRAELGTHVRSYHIELSTKRSGTGVRSPRHVVFYTLKHEGAIVVLRILHDTMLPGQHVSEDEPPSPSA